jgi:hypothetical protein
MQPHSGESGKSAKAGTQTRRSTKTKATLHVKPKSTLSVDHGNASDMADLIATAAYYRAEHRGFEPGHELEDWLAAEQQIRAPNS